MARDAILVTGVNGLIGHATARRLSTSGKQVVGVDRVVPDELPCPVVRTADLADVHRLYALIAEHGIGAIVHAGGVSGPMLARDNPYLIAETNIGGTMHVLEAARAAKIRRLVWFSSIMAYGERTDLAPVDEDSPLLAANLYGATKVAGEALLRAYAAEYGLDGVALRVSSVYGPRRTTDCFVRLLIENALAGHPTRLAPSPGIFRQHVHVEDVVDAILLCLDAPRLPRRAYNITGGTFLSTEEVAAAVAEGVPGVRLEFDPAAPAAGGHRIGPLAIGNAQRELGYAPKIALADGARRYAEWLRARNATLGGKAPQ